MINPTNNFSSAVTKKYIIKLSKACKRQSFINVNIISDARTPRKSVINVISLPKQINKIIKRP
jgi:hypothetical protein